RAGERRDRSRRRPPVADRELRGPRAQLRRAGRQVHAGDRLGGRGEPIAGRRVTYRLGVDVGGTFTDVLLHDSERQRVWLAKTPSTPQDQSVGVIDGIRLAADKAEI